MKTHDFHAELWRPRPVADIFGFFADAYNLQALTPAWEPTHRFVDEQKRGPYRLWIHAHRFTSQKGGTLCSNHVRYAVLGGELVNRLFVRRDVEKIFAFRCRKLEEMFGRC